KTGKLYEEICKKDKELKEQAAYKLKIDNIKKNEIKNVSELKKLKKLIAIDYNRIQEKETFDFYIYYNPDTKMIDVSEDINKSKEDKFVMKAIIYRESDKLYLGIEKIHHNTTNYPQLPDAEADLMRKEVLDIYKLRPLWVEYEPKY